MSTWRGSPFVPGAEYRVVGPGRNWSGNGSGGDLVAGQVLRYVDANYSRYDECSAYVFADGDGRVFWWALHDEEPVETWREIVAACR